MQDFLTASIIVIPTAFALLMCVDFIAGLRNLIPASPQVTGSVTFTPDPLTLPEKQDCVLSSLTINALSRLPDPWTLPTQEMTTTRIAAPKPAPTLLLLPPSKNPYAETLPPATKGKQRKALIDAEFTDSTPATATPKRRGRPRKAA